MASIFRILILLASVAIVFPEEFAFDYTPENAKGVIEDYQNHKKAGGPRLQCDLLNADYAVPMSRVENRFGLQFTAADSILLKTDGPDWTGSSYSKIPIAMDKRPGIKVYLKNSVTLTKRFISGPDHKVFYFSEMHIKVEKDECSNIYLEFLVTFSDSQDKDSVQVKMPLFAKSKKQVIGSPALTINIPIIRQLELSNSASGRNSLKDAFVADIWWMKDVLDNALYKSTDKEDKKRTDVYITHPVIMELEEMKKLLNLDSNVLKHFVDE